MQEPREPSATYCQEVAVDPFGRLCLRTSSESLVDVVDVETGKRVAIHETVYSFGGHRLAISDDLQHFIAGSWGNPKGGGVACYETLTGKCVWHNRTLSRPQYVAYERHSDSWFVSMATGGTVFASRFRGMPKSKLRGSSRHFLGNFHEKCVVTHKQGVALANPADGCEEVVVKFPQMYEWLEGKDRYGEPLRIMHASTASSYHDSRKCRPTGVLAASVDGDSVVVAHVAGVMQCYSLSSGALCWETIPPPLSHFLTVGIARSDAIVWAHQWPYQHGGPTSLWRLDLASGRVLSKQVWRFGNPCFSAFCRAGTLCVTAAEQVKLPRTVTRRFNP